MHHQINISEMRTHVLCMYVLQQTKKRSVLAEYAKFNSFFSYAVFLCTPYLCLLIPPSPPSLPSLPPPSLSPFLPSLPPSPPSLPPSFHPSSPLYRVCQNFRGGFNFAIFVGPCSNCKIEKKFIQQSSHQHLTNLRQPTVAMHTEASITMQYRICPN